MRRNGKEFIGADFAHVVPVNDNVASDLTGFCGETITPAEQLQDDDAAVLNDAGGQHTYCIRALIEDTTNEKTDSIATRTTHKNTLTADLESLTGT